MKTSAPVAALVLTMFFLAACAACAALAACSRSALDANAGDGGGAGSAAASAPVAANGAAPPPSGPCTFALDAAPASLDKVPPSDLARAIIPTLDVKTMKARPLAAGPVVDCLDDPAETDWGGHAPPIPPKGKVEVRLRQPLALGRELVWVMTGYPPGACSSEEGFVAIEHLDGAVVVADAVGKWTQECGSPKRMRVARLAGEDVYLEDTPSGTGAQRETTESLWMVRGKRMVRAGGWSIEADAAGLETEDHWLYAMTAKPELQGDQVLVHETWTWTSSLPADAGAPRPKTKANLRKFALKDGKLVALSAEGPPAMP